VSPTRNGRRLGKLLVAAAALLLLSGLAIAAAHDLPAVLRGGRSSPLSPLAVAAAVVLLDVGKKLEAGRPAEPSRTSLVVMAVATALTVLRLAC
jgi:hypothetical protein